jgi:hypothetical protein
MAANQPPQSFDQLNDSLVLDAHHLANVSKDLNTLVQMVDQVRSLAEAADKQLGVGTYGINPFGDGRAGPAIDTLKSRTRSVADNVKGSLDSLHSSLDGAAKALARIAQAVHDDSQDHSHQLKHLLDTAFGGARPPTHAAPITPPGRH